MKDNDQICLTIGEIRAFISMLPGNILLQKLRVVSYDKKSFIVLVPEVEFGPLLHGVQRP